MCTQITIRYNINKYWTKKLLYVLCNNKYNYFDNKYNKTIEQKLIENFTPKSDIFLLRLLKLF